LISKRCAQNVNHIFSQNCVLTHLVKYQECKMVPNIKLYHFKLKKF